MSIDETQVGQDESKTTPRGQWKVSRFAPSIAICDLLPYRHALLAGPSFSPRRQLKFLSCYSSSATISLAKFSPRRTQKSDDWPNCLLPTICSCVFSATNSAFFSTFFSSLELLPTDDSQSSIANWSAPARDRKMEKNNYSQFVESLASGNRLSPYNLRRFWKLVSSICGIEALSFAYICRNRRLAMLYNYPQHRVSLPTVHFSICIYFSALEINERSRNQDVIILFSPSTCYKHFIHWNFFNFLQ